MVRKPKKTRREDGPTRRPLLFAPSLSLFERFGGRTYLSGVEETVSGGLGEVDLEGELDGLGLGGGGLGGHGY